MAVEISLDLERFGKVKRLYDLPVYIENSDIPVSNPNTNPDTDQK
jgi:hypothetical protein